MSNVENGCWSSEEKMKVRWFWLLSDHKTIREISWDQWKKIVEKDFEKRSHTRLICRVCDSEIYFRKGSDFLWIPMDQLKEILSS